MMGKLQPQVKVFNHIRTKDAKWEMEIGGKMYPLSAFTDEAMDATVKRAGLWKKGQDYPEFTVYKDGEEHGGGGGGRSGGTMDSTQPRVRIFNHRAGDAFTPDRPPMIGQLVRTTEGEQGRIVSVDAARNTASVEFRTTKKYAFDDLR